MSRWLHAVFHLLLEAQAARRDARVRFLLAQITILRRKLRGNRVIVRPQDRHWLLSLGQEFGHQVKSLIGIVQPETYCRGVVDQEEGRRARRVGRPKVPAVGIIVDTVSEVLDITDENVEPPPEMTGAVDTAFIPGMGKVGNAVKILLDIDRVLNAGELAAVAATGAAF